MNKTKIALFLVPFFSLNIFAQDAVSQEAAPQITAPKLSILDSIKNTFVDHEVASCVDKEWMDELTNQDLFKEMEFDIAHMNPDEKVDYDLSTDLLKARLKEMDAKSPFNIEYNQGLENIIKSFLKNRKKSYERLMAISEYYFPMFEAALAKYDVPLEIKYLAVVESALNPHARSRVGATGLWQFMFATGKQYNLDVSSYIDERSDPLKATEAACQYLSNMFKIFGDWDLVLASYNAGPGNVSKAIRRSGGQQNYWNIRKNLPKETQGYVPAFLATMYIYEYHKEHGIEPKRAAISYFATDTVMVKREMTFKQISDLLDIPESQIKLLNPGYKLDVIPFVKGKNHYLRLPLPKIAVFTSNEDKIYAYAQIEEDKREKPYFSRKSTLPAGGNTTETAIASTDSKSPYIDYSEEPEIVKGSKIVTKTKYHTVKKGDNIGEISQKYGVSIAEIKKWNRLKNNNVMLGAKLKIQTSERVATTVVKKTPKPAAKTKETTETAIAAVEKQEAKTKEVATDDTDNKEDDKSEFYVVQKGDNLNSIARKYGVTVAEIKEWNNLEDTNVLSGSKLKLIPNENAPVIETKAEKAQQQIASSAKVHQYLVQKGDSLFSIAKKYPGVTVENIKKWNDIRNENIKPGMKLKIQG
ncbi:LysM peptidoglycan-binding domain-containing protein [Flavobacterium lindanitolerans]|uniref:Membrane-bound lytic murein transglycosylase D n=1 Tax=Flavobacterium lindanitolerans TaxID=428988 RepID=A0A497V8E7_9FLAO|nr:LysM peptidoglycan-binding domain-containing protein [Flavobacterium lindanitolerans]PKW28921.1 membrane-bound lytic murein transglycosylase D [Flavobacterium lindanitolerans]RLJ35576.1 membrane-bound lytic murein transglycosylase D [Flavobacterium lindanitolerans]